MPPLLGIVEGRPIFAWPPPEPIWDGDRLVAVIEHEPRGRDRRMRPPQRVVNVLPPDTAAVRKVRA